MRYIAFILLFVSAFAKNILIINSYSITMGWTKKELEGILKTLKNSNKIYVEFMNTKVFRPTPARISAFVDYLYSKYGNMKIDIIITTDDNALNFIRRYKSTPLFKNAKVFFCGVNNLSLADVLDKNEYTGVFEKKEPLANLRFAKKIKRNLKMVYLVLDNSTSAKGVLNLYKKSLSHVKNINFVYLNDSNLSDILSALRKSDKNSVMFFLTPFSFRYKDKHISYIKVAQLLSKEYNNPMIVHCDMLVDILNTNIMGGKVTDGFSQGVEVAKKVKEFLNGKDIKDIPFTFEKANKMYLNVKNLQKFGINAYELGYKNAIYINKPTSFFEVYKKWIVMFLVVVVFVVMVLILLAIRNRMLSKYNEEIKKINDSLELKVKKTVEEITQKDKILANQAKLAAMGEMIGAIAHQWRQPLNSLAINIQSLPELIEENGCKEEVIDSFVAKNMQTIFFMSNTIDDFRNFFKDNSKKSFLV
ncbi:MAG: ABC transporter substrate binding protein [Nautiliaceae bacterium]